MTTTYDFNVLWKLHGNSVLISKGGKLLYNCHNNCDYTKLQLQ